MGWEGMVCDEMVWNEWYAKANIPLDQNIKTSKRVNKTEKSSNKFELTKVSEHK
jgi:hypothetical protein